MDGWDDDGGDVGEGGKEPEQIDYQELKEQLILIREAAKKVPSLVVLPLKGKGVKGWTTKKK